MFPKIILGTGNNWAHDWGLQKLGWFRRQTQSWEWKFSQFSHNKKFLKQIWTAPPPPPPNLFHAKKKRYFFWNCLPERVRSMVIGQRGDWSQLEAKVKVKVRRNVCMCAGCGSKRGLSWKQKWKWKLGRRGGAGAEVMGCMPEPRSLVPSRDALLDLEGGNHTLLEHLRQLICGWGGGTFHLGTSLYQNFLC